MTRYLSNSIGVISLVLAACAVGCKGPAPQSLLGMDESTLVAEMGKPDGRESFTITAESQRMAELRFGPRPPRELRPGDECVELYYEHAWGKFWYVYLASPAAFERIQHRPSPMTKPCVVNVQDYPEDTVF